MGIARIISSGTPGAESAALDAAIRFRMPYEGYTHQGALIPGDRPAGRYRLEERPFVPRTLLLEANLARADGVVLFSSGPLPHPLRRLATRCGRLGRPCLHIDFNTILPEQAAFRIAAWAQRYELAGLLVSGTDLREDNTIYQRVQATMNAMFMLVGSAGASPSGHH